MKNIQVFTAEEDAIINEIRSILPGAENTDELKMMENGLNAIMKLADSISLYPSIMDHQTLANHSRTIETLVDNICSHTGLDFEMNTPTKAVLGRGFTIAKMNFFLLTSYLCDELSHLCYHEENIKKIVTLHVFSIMSEDVFISIILDHTLDTDLRRNAGFLLARIWEHRVYGGIEEIEPVLSDLWTARLSFEPSFGTLRGVSEITSFCAGRNRLLLRFIEDSEFSDDAYESLREYLMGLSHEEIGKIEKAMEKKTISAYSHSAVERITGSGKSYPLLNHADPREMHLFYERRRNNAEFRRKSSLSGPKKTIEEYIICYMINQGMIKHGF